MSDATQADATLGRAGISLFRLGGIEVRLDYTWFFIFALVLASLAAGYFPREHPDLHLALRRGSERVVVPKSLEPLAQSVLAEAVRNAHKHARPEESSEKLQDFWKAIHDEAIAANPQAVVELCPCGDSFAFHNLPATNNTPASDPLSSWQIRLKGKTFKALMGPSAPYAGDHVELSDRGDDFASTYGIGAIPSTKFTWPKDTPKPMEKLPPGGFVLTPAKEAIWRKWIALYRENMLPKGRYLGGLYDIGFDKPEAHAIEKDGVLHYAFYADRWSGPIALHGLGEGDYTLVDAFSGRSLGTASRARSTIDATFERALLIRATPNARGAA